MYKDDVIKIDLLINNYFEGLYFGNLIKLKSCFHENCHLYGDIKDVIYLNSLKEYFEKVKNRQSPKELNEDFKMKILGIDIIGKTAMTKLHVPMLGYNYYDYLSLFKINNNWKIINKIFTHVE